MNAAGQMVETEHAPPTPTAAATLLPPPDTPPTSATVEEPGVKELEQALETAIETLGGVASLLTKYSHDVQDTLYGKINEVVGDLVALDKASEKVDSAIPRDILGAIDRGRNPQQMTYRSLEDVAQVSVSAKAKLSAMREFKLALQEQIGAASTSEQPSAVVSNLSGRPGDMAGSNGIFNAPP